ncbi:MAG: hypothetical protein AAF926_07915, partial [Pseudomonadota bacterium]
MRIDAFRFRYLGPFGAEGVSVDGLVPGLNVIAEHNERGKTSLLRGLQLFLLQGHSRWGKRGHAVNREDGSTTGEIDFTHDGTAYRLVKTYQRGKDAQLIDRSNGAVLARKGEADEWLARLMGTLDKASGPSGLLWIEQGQSMKAVQDDGLVASKIETEMSSLIGGDRARDYLSRTETALGELLTATGRPRVGGPLKKAEDALTEIELRLDAAEKRRGETRQIGRNLDRARTALASLADQADDDMDARLAQARDDLEKARTARTQWDRAHAVKLRLETEAERADERLSRHLGHVTDYDAASEGVARQDRIIAESETRRQALHEDLKKVDQTLRRLRKVQTQLAEREAARARSDRLRDRQDALSRLNQRLEALDDVRVIRRRQIEVRNAIPDIDPAMLKHLGELDARSGQLERALDDVAAYLNLDLLPGVEAKLDDVALPSGTVRLTATSVLHLPGLGDIRLDPPQADAIRAELEQIRHETDRLLEQAGVADYAEAADAVRVRADLSAELQSLNRDIARIAPDGRDTLIDHREALERDITTLTDSLSRQSERTSDTDDANLAADLAEHSAQRAVIEDALQDVIGQIEAAKARQDEEKRRLTSLPDSAAPETRHDEQTHLAMAAATAQARLEDASADL